MSGNEIMQFMEDIRERLKRSGRVMILSSRHAFTRGAFVIAGCVASFFMLSGPPWQMIVLWLGVAAAALITEGALFLMLKMKSPDKYVSGLERQILKMQILIVAVGFVLSFALYRNSAGAMIPGLWLTLVGLIYVICGYFSFSNTWVLGLLACAGGCASLFLPPLYFFIILGVILGVGSLVYGIIIKTTEPKGE
ncbi:MAG: hypothetical protein ACYS8W_15115 [Planctomycetota bacterium]|jgi:MFS family permease